MSENQEVTNEEKVEQIKDFLRSKGFTYRVTAELTFTSDNEKGTHNVDIMSGWRGDYFIIKYNNDHGEVYGFQVLRSQIRMTPKEGAVRSFEQVMADLENELADVPTVERNF